MPAGSTCRQDGLAFPPCGVDDLPHRAAAARGGGVLEQRRHGRGGLVARARRPAGVPRSALGRLCRARRRRTNTPRACFRQYGLKTDRQRPVRGDVQAVSSDRLGTRTSRSLSAALRGEPTGQARGFRGDVVAVAKRRLKAGEKLDGEGGYTVWGKLVPATKSLADGALPIGLAHRVPPGTRRRARRRAALERRRGDPE